MDFVETDASNADVARQTKNKRRKVIELNLNGQHSTIKHLPTIGRNYVNVRRWHQAFCMEHASDGTTAFTVH
jgi:hypothetical protein